MSKVIIADWDGTLFDSMNGIYKTLIYTISNEFDAPEQDIVRYFKENLGTPFAKLVSNYYETNFEKKMNYHEIKRIETEFYKRMNKLDDYCSLYLDVLPFLEKMKDENIRVYVSSSSRVDRINRVVKPFVEHKLIEGIFGFDFSKPEFTKGKGHYEEIKKQETKKGNNNPQPIFLGDTISDIHAAKEISLIARIRIGTFDKKTILQHEGTPFKTLKEIN